MAYKRYEKYKDSGVEWIGEIPEDWETLKIKHIGNIISGYAFKSSDFCEEGIKTIKINNIQAMGLDWTDTSYLPKEFSKLYSNFSTRKDDIAIALTRPIISTGIKVAIIENEEEKLINQRTCLLRIRKGDRLERRFIYYIINSEYFIEQFKSYVKTTNQPNISPEDIAKIKLFTPNMHDQKQISGFLDKRTSEIDSLISDKEKLIELLKEKRQAIITEAVTMGLNPNVKMKDSGVEWIGEIPEHWKTSKIKYSTYVKGRIGWQGLKSDEFIEEGPYLVTGTDFVEGRISWNSCYHISDERYREAPPIQLKENDLLITKDGTIGKIALVINKPDKAILNSGIFVTRCLNGEYLTKYMYWLLNSEVFSRYIDIEETGSTIKHLYQEVFVNFSYPIPNLEEQKLITGFLDEKVEKMDKTVEAIEKQKNELLYYKQSLISEAVIGKIDVRKYNDGVKL